MMLLQIMKQNNIGKNGMKLSKTIMYKRNDSHELNWISHCFFDVSSETKIITLRMLTIYYTKASFCSRFFFGKFIIFRSMSAFAQLLTISNRLFLKCCSSILNKGNFNI